MNDKPPSTSGSGTPGLVARIKRAFKGEPWSRDEIQTFIQSEVELDAEEKSMLFGVLEVSDLHPRRRALGLGENIASQRPGDGNRRIVQRPPVFYQNL